MLRRQALEEQLRTRPPFDPRLDEAEEVIADFGRIWPLEEDPAKRRRLLATLFDRVWQDGGTLPVAALRERFPEIEPTPYPHHADALGGFSVATVQSDVVHFLTAGLLLPPRPSVTVMVRV